MQEPYFYLLREFMPQLSSGHVFISYSRKDDVVMHRVVAFLRRQGLKVWVDNEKLTPGTPVWEAEIEKAIKGASAIVIVLSPDSKDSEWVRREISLADQYRKRVFPVLVRGDEESSITLRLINRQFVDIRENENAGLGSLVAALLARLQELSDEEEKVKEREYLVNKKASDEQITGRETLNLGTGNTTALRIDPQGILWVTLGWAIAGLIGGFIYSEYGEIAGGAIGGTIGGLVTSIALRVENDPSNQKNMIKTTLAWAIGGAIGWLIGWELTEAIGAGIGMTIFAMIGMASTLRRDYILSNWKSITWITLAWGICGAIGWSIAKGLIDGLYIENAIGWAIGTAIGWAIGGFVMSWQLMRR
jgi:hypothetical protein